MRARGTAVAALLVLASGAPAAAQPSWGDRLADRDVALSDMGAAAGVWSDRDTVWVSDWSGSAVRAYALRGGARRAALDMAELPARNAAGLWSDGDTLWVADFGSEAVYARRLDTGAAVEGRSLTGLDDGGNDAPTGIWSDGTTLWAADYYHRKAYAYALSDGARTVSRELALDGSKRPFGLWSDGETLLVADWTGGRVLAYRLSDGARMEERDIATSAAGNSRPMGLWSDGETLWVTDELDDKLYAYAVPGLREVRPPAGVDPSLESLSLSDVDIGTFARTTTSYAAEVARDVETTTVTALPAVSGATVAITPADADSGTAGHQVELAVGRTLVEVAVTARNGVTRRTYAVTVTKPSDDASLKSLSLTGMDIGAFSAQRLDYSGHAAYEVDSTTVAATVSHGGATLTVTPADADEGTPGHQVALAFGETVIEVRVLAQDATTERTYTVNVARAGPSTDTALRSLGLTGVDIGAFDPADEVFAGSAAYEVSTTTVIAALRHAGAAVEVSPADSDVAAAGHQVRLAVGTTTVEIRVVAQDGTTERTYTGTVVRAEPSPDAALRYLRLTGVDIGLFDPAHEVFAGSAEHEVSSTTVIATPRHAAAVVRVSPPDTDGAATGHQVALAVGETAVEIRVVAQDGTTERTYTGTVVRAGPSTDAALRSLRLSRIDMGLFLPDERSYDASVPYVVASTTVTAAPRHTGATVEISPADADDAATGHQVRLPTGTTVVEVRVVAQDGTTERTYTVTVVRSEDLAVVLTIGEDDRVRIGLPSSADRYHVLYLPVGCRRREDGARCGDPVRRTRRRGTDRTAQRRHWRRLPHCDVFDGLTRRHGRRWRG